MGKKSHKKRKGLKEKGRRKGKEKGNKAKQNDSEANLSREELEKKAKKWLELRKDSYFLYLNQQKTRAPMQEFRGKTGLLRLQSLHLQTFAVNKIGFRSKTFSYFVQCPMKMYKQPIGGDEEEDKKKGGKKQKKGKK